MSTALTEDVPISRPMYIFPGRSLCPRPLGLRNVVSHEDIDADAFLAGVDGEPLALGDEHARGAPRLMAGVLIDDGVDRAAHEIAARQRGQFMGDEDDIASAAACFERRDDAA